jgi:hypothetical protein
MTARGIGRIEQASYGQQRLRVDPLIRPDIQALTKTKSEGHKSKFKTIRASQIIDATMVPK